MWGLVCSKIVKNFEKKLEFYFFHQKVNKGNCLSKIFSLLTIWVGPGSSILAYQGKINTFIIQINEAKYFLIYFYLFQDLKYLFGLLSLRNFPEDFYGYKCFQ
jgi:hypothetical protein